MSNIKEYYRLEDKLDQISTDINSVMRLIKTYSGDVTLSCLFDLLDKERDLLRSAMENAEHTDEFIHSHNLRGVIYDLMKANNISYDELSKQINYKEFEIEQTLKGEQPADYNYIFLKLCEHFDIPKKRFIRYLLPQNSYNLLKRINT